MGCKIIFTECADLHLGDRFEGVNPEDQTKRERIYESTFKSFSKIVDISIERSDFMVISGDVYDEAVMTPRTKMRFVDELKRFGKRCFIVRGNHDYKDPWADTIPYPDNVTEILSTKDRYMLKINGMEIEIIGTSYDSAHTSENLASTLRGSRGVYTIGIVHCSVKEVAEGNVYAPCCVEDLMGKDVDFWALGHIHKRTVVRENYPTIVYPGNIQGRNSSETGEKGCYIVTVEDREARLEFVPTQDILWQRMDIDICGMTTLNDLVARVRSDSIPGSIVSLDIRGKGPLDHLLRKGGRGIREYLSEATGSDVLIHSLGTKSEKLHDDRENVPMVASVIDASKKYQEMDDYELLDVLCKSGPAMEMRPFLEYYAEKGRLHGLVEQAKLSLIDRLVGDD
ncbi:MAG: DNA repair exonuclease [archaeon]|nr:DNA repair exonuclease [archaeon]